jgi:hypothetical protein
VERLVTVADVQDDVADDRHVSVSARHEAVLAERLLTRIDHDDARDPHDS